MAYIGVDNIARQINNMYIGVDGVARQITRAYIGVDGVARLFWTSDWPEFLQDFKGYIEKNGDKTTYVITDWKGTYNGQPSTKIIIPDNENILL